MRNMFNISNNFSQYINNLPQDLKTKIYKQYFWFDVEKKPKCDCIIDWFQNSDDAQKLRRNDNILNTINKLLKNETCIEYMRNQDKEFNSCYIYHYIDNKQNFVKLSKLESFVLSILMYKYH